jgi:hypothetical protein
MRRHRMAPSSPCWSRQKLRRTGRSRRLRERSSLRGHHLHRSRSRRLHRRNHTRSNRWHRIHATHPRTQPTTARHTRTSHRLIPPSKLTRRKFCHRPMPTRLDRLIYSLPLWAPLNSSHRTHILPTEATARHNTHLPSNILPPTSGFLRSPQDRTLRAGKAHINSHGHTFRLLGNTRTLSTRCNMLSRPRKLASCFRRSRYCPRIRPALTLLRGRRPTIPRCRRPWATDSRLAGRMCRHQYPADQACRLCIHWSLRRGSPSPLR